MAGGQCMLACPTFPCKNDEFHIFMFPLVCSRTLQKLHVLAKVSMANLLDPVFHLIQKGY